MTGNWPGRCAVLACALATAVWTALAPGWGVGPGAIQLLAAAQPAQAGGRPAQPPQGPGARPPAAPPRLPARDARPNPDAPAGTAALRGQVVVADTGTPIRRAQVRVSGQTIREARLATTDAQGRFEIRELAAGRYTLSASKGGFVTLQYGQRRPGESGTPLDLADGQTLDKLIIGLPRGSVIGGRIADEFGEPVANAAVVAFRYAYVGGTRRLVPAGARDTTDDQGQYRLFGLPPGDYVVSASLRTAEVTDPSGDEPSGYAPTYFPGTSSPAEAQRVTLGLAQENTGVSFGLIATRLVRVSGQVISSGGGPTPGGAVTLNAIGGPGGARQLMQGGSARVDGTGAFRISNVAPGRYQLTARTGGRAESEFARLDITVGAEDVSGLTLVAAPGARVRGTVVSDTGRPFPFPPSQVQVSARQAGGDAMFGAGGGQGGGGRVAADGSFEIVNVIEPRLFRVSAPEGWALKSATLNGQDITDTPVDFAPGQTVTGLAIVLTQRLSAVSGTIVDDRGQPVLDATVVVFPPDEALWTFLSRYIKAARPNQEGRYTIAALPARDYLAVAVQGLQDGQAGDPDVLASLKARAVGFSLKEGQSGVLDLRLSTR